MFCRGQNDRPRQQVSRSLGVTADVEIDFRLCHNLTKPACCSKCREVCAALGDVPGESVDITFVFACSGFEGLPLFYQQFVMFSLCTQTFVFTLMRQTRNAFLIRLPGASDPFEVTFNARINSATITSLVRISVHGCTFLCSVFNKLTF